MANTMANTMVNTMVNTTANTMFNREEKVNEMIALLQKYGHDAATDGCEEIYDIWAENKAALWELLSKDKTFKNGKITIPTQDVLKADLYNAKDMISNQMLKLTRVTGTEYPDYKRPLYYTNEDCLVTPTAAAIFEDWGIKAVEGQKITKPYLKLFEKIGLPYFINELAEANAYEINGRKHYSGECPSYEQWKAKFTDYCSVKTKNYNLYLSIDPIDYLTMSFGNSWASCHTIDYDNLRRIQGEGYHGQYRAGTISYMLDKVTMIGYWISNDKAEEPAYEPKVIRQTFHFDAIKGILVQGRLYPRDQNNSDASLYNHLRLAVEGRLAELMDEPNKWLKKANSAKSNLSWINTAYNSLHYTDYANYPNPQLALLKSKQIVVEESGSEEDEGKTKYEPQYIEIGHKVPCVRCGEVHGNTDSLVCDDCDHSRATCEHCGCIIDLEEEDYYTDGYGYYYCRDCCNICCNCGDLIPPNESVYSVDGDDYCEHCLQRLIDEGDVAYCEYHEEYEYEDGHEYVENYGYMCRRGLQTEIDFGNAGWCEYHEQYEYETGIEPVHDDPDDIDIEHNICERARDALGVVYCDECNEYFIPDFMNCLSDNNLNDRNLCDSCYKAELEELSTTAITKEAE